MTAFLPDRSFVDVILLSASEIARNAPGSHGFVFVEPGRRWWRTRNLAPGLFVELCANGHFFTVQISERLNRSNYIGEFISLPFPSMADPPFLAFYHNRIRFQARHICRILEPSGTESVGA